MKHRNLYKKSAEFKFIYLVIWAIFLVFVFMIIVLYTSAFVRQRIDVRDAEARVIINRLMYSRTGISYVDEELGRSYPGTVDLKKLTSEFLDSSLLMDDNQMIAAQVVVSSSSLNISHEAIFNELWYFRWLPLAGRKGSGASTWISEERYVSIYDGDRFLGPGVMEINVLMPNG